MTASGLMMISASRQSFQSLERQTQKRRSRRRSFGRLSERLRTRSCCRRTRISAASDSLETNRDRKNRKNAEKMAIRVERSISNNEGEGQKNRIAASSAKCKENMAGWTFYQGQVVNKSSGTIPWDWVVVFRYNPKHEYFRRVMSDWEELTKKQGMTICVDKYGEHIRKVHQDIYLNDKGIKVIDTSNR